ncbi:hypothetical protein CK203_085606 [Vitis vinifera]|uniref:Uncharacterized protein n=1 Tax=Vitis vinifera TaxID=29760 RepID=A0A438BWG6_VITVI|nr:hypothetical protein CK203_085606 [Vitis vinifera]
MQMQMSVVYSVSRWKSSDVHSTNEFNKSSKKKKIPAKVLRYFPLRPRLQRLYMSSKMASHMKWHVDGHMTGEMMRHPMDSLAWKNFDEVGALKGNLLVLFVIRIIAHIDYKMDENGVTWVIVDFYQLIIDFNVIKGLLMEMRSIENCLEKMFYIN